MEPKWLECVKRLDAIVQNGLAFAESPFDIERYVTIRQVAAKMLVPGSGTEIVPSEERFKDRAAGPLPHGHTPPLFQPRHLMNAHGVCALPTKR